MIPSRRRFLGGVSAATLAARFDAGSVVSAFTDDYEFKVGYHTAPWGENTEQAIEEISALGFRGIQIQTGDYQKYASRPAEFKSLMAAKNLTVVSISSGGLTIKPDTEKQEIADRFAMAKWLKDVGGLYLQATDSARAKSGVNDHDDYKKLSKRLNEIGKRSFGEYGIKLSYHNDMGSLGERPDDMTRILDATDPKNVWALVDIAHVQAAGGDPVRFTRDYINRLAYPHFKDVLIQKTQTSLDGKGGRPKVDFVELGQGVVNIPGVLQIMKDYRYKGWIVIELDRAPGGRTPKESAAISKRYVEEKLKLKI
jgi:inosose dehydratase